MPKHHWRKSVESFLGNHIDSEKDEELKGTKTEIEEKVVKILNLIKEEEGEKVGNTVENMELLVTLILDFHKHYLSIYDRYDHLTGELRKKIHGKQEKENSSSSGSDSDSDYSSNEMGSKNGEIETDFQKGAEGIKQELESANLEVDDLKRKLTDMVEEKEVLQCEYQTSLNKIQAAEKMISDLKIEAETFNDEKSKLSLEIKDMNVKLDSANTSAAEMNLILEDITGEKTNLLMEKETALRMIKEGEKIREELEVTTNGLSDENKTLQLQLSTMKKKLESSEREVTNLMQTQKSTEEKSTKNLELSNEISEAQYKIQSVVAECNLLREKLNEREKEFVSHAEMHESYKNETSVRMRNLELELDSLHTQKREIEQQKGDELSTLLKKLEDKERDLSQFEDLTTKVKIMEQETESLQIQRSKLEELMVHERNEASGQVKVLMEKVYEKQQEVESENTQKIEFESQLEKKIQEISEYLVRIETLEEESRNKSSDLQKLLGERDGFMAQVKGQKLEVESLKTLKHELEDRIIELEKTLTEHVNEISGLQKSCEDRENDASAQITNLTTQVNNLQMEVDSLNIQKAESESQVAKKALEIAQFLDQIENLKEDSEVKTVNVQKMLEERDGLKVQMENLQMEKSKLQEQRENRIKDIEGLRKENEDLQERIAELEETVEDLRRDLEMKGDEVSTLEVKLRLSNQKLRVTEQVLTEKEESHMSKENKFQQEQNLLEERVSSLSASFAIYNKAQVKIIRDISEKVKNATNGVDTLTLKFEEDYGHFETRVYEISNEIQVAKNWAKWRNTEREELKREVGMLVKQLEDKKEEESVLRKRVGELEGKLGKVEEEKQSVLKAVKVVEERTRALENMMREKDECISVIEEEKREAIRQLCIWIDYHRSHCDYLKKMLSNRSGRRPVAS